jgi:hypothetical protein
MVATTTIGEGDTRDCGLSKIVKDEGTIIFVHRFIKWPGEANLEVHLITIHKGQWNNEKIIDTNSVAYISSRLDPDQESKPKELRENAKKVFQGSILQGIGFALSKDEACQLIDSNPQNQDCIFPLMNGQDLNNSPDQSPSRYVINFLNWSKSEAEKYPDLMKIVEKRVKPERDRIKRERNRTNWWIYAENRPGLYTSISRLKRVLVRSLTSELHMLAFVKTGYVYTHSLGVFVFEDNYHFAILQSNIHEIWMFKNKSSLESRTRYIQSECFETFPFPQSPKKVNLQSVEDIGAEYHEYRRQIMLNRQIGLTPTYNLFNDPSCTDADIQTLRELHAAMDNAVLACYGWQDIQLNHNFYQNDRGQTRFTIAPEARIELLNRLLELNLSIAEQEQLGETEEEEEPET